jgi:hypothetical protein
VDSPNHKDFSDTRLCDFLVTLVEHISESSMKILSINSELEYVIYLKDLYDILSLTTRYQKKKTQDVIIKLMLDLNLLNKLQAFEEAIGLLFSIIYSYNDRYDEMQNIFHEWQTTGAYFMDKNVNR